MQYKKKFVNDKILEAGRNEYLAKGYRAGNISTIAENAGVPVGNLYRYFDGKSGLLDAIVKNTYIELPKQINQLAAIDNNKELNMPEVMTMLAKQLLSLFDSCGKEILILVDKCATTRYEDFAEKITMQVSNLVLTKVYKEPSSIDKLMSQIISKAFINSIFDVLRMDKPPMEMQEILIRILKYYFIGAETGM